MARLFGCLLNVEGEGGGGGNSVVAEASRSGIQPDVEAMCLSVGLPPLVERENNEYHRFIESKPDSGSAPMDSESDGRNCLIDFFDLETYEFQRARGNQRISPCEFDIWEEEKLVLGLGIGSGSGSESGQVRGDSGAVQVTGNKEIGSVPVNVGTDLTRGLDDHFGVVEVGTAGLTPIEFEFGSDREAMVVDEQLEWEDSQNNAITLVSDPVLLPILSILEEEEGGDEPYLAYMDEYLVEEEEALQQILLPINDLMDLDYDLFLASIEELGGDEDYVYGLPQTFDQEDPEIMAKPPASKAVVDALPLVEFTSQELSSGNFVCAICTDDILVHEKVNRLPCRHYYHGGCIITWLGIRNTCPVCRYELPTDDPEYERNRRS